MQQNLKLNLHGVVGILLVILMFGIAFFLNWNINWIYFVAAVGLYAIATIYLTTHQANLERRGRYTEADRLDTLRLLFVCHCALLFLAMGLWLHFPSDLTNAAFFLASAAVGLVIPFSLFILETRAQVSNAGGHESILAITSGKFNPYGILGGVAIILMFGFAFRWQWNINWWYFLGATILYSIAVTRLTLLYQYLQHELAIENVRYRSESKDGDPGLLIIFRLLLGCHLAFLILAVGLLLHFQNNGIDLAFFLAGTAAGVAFPFLLIRS